MEKLHLRSDGYSETPSGLFATVMQRYTGVTPDGQRYHFTFRTCPACEGTRLEWPINTSVMLLSQDIVSFIEGKGYARALVGEEVDAYNAAVDAYIEAMGAISEPGAIPDGIDGEDAPEGGPEGEGGASEEEPPPIVPEPGSEEPPAPVATEDGAGETPPAESSTEPASSDKKAKKG